MLQFQQHLFRAFCFHKWRHVPCGIMASFIIPSPSILNIWKRGELTALNDPLLEIRSSRGWDFIASHLPCVFYCIKGEIRELKQQTFLRSRTPTGSHSRQCEYTAHVFAYERSSRRGPFSSPEPVVSCSRGLETRGSGSSRYRMSENFWHPVAHVQN